MIKRDDGAVVAFELKASGSVPGDDLRHLRKLREALGEPFKAGVVFCTGERSYTFEDHLHVLPLSRLWTPVEGPPKPPSPKRQKGASRAKGVTRERSRRVAAHAVR